eukprot:scaffold96327_cov60-Phaeocystis_antarctica.AAC.1
MVTQATATNWLSSPRQPATVIMGLRPMMSRPRLFWSRPTRMCQTCCTSCPNPAPNLVPKRVVHCRASLYANPCSPRP